MKFPVLFLGRKSNAPECSNCGSKKTEKLTEFKDQWLCSECGTITVRPDKELTKPRKMEEQTRGDTGKRGWPVVRK